MSKTKKYLLLASAIVLLLWGAFLAFLAIQHFTDVTKVAGIENFVSKNFGGLDNETVTLVARLAVAFVASGALISLAFGGFTLRFCFYTPQQYEMKRSITITMAVLSFIVVVNPFIGILFLIAALIKDHNYVPQAPQTSTVDSLEEKLRKLLDLKEKNLISEEEYNKLRSNILS